MEIETALAIWFVSINTYVLCFSIYSLVKETRWFKKKSFDHLVIEEIKAVPRLDTRVDTCMNMADMTRTNVINIAKKGYKHEK
jgi:hypothetical protein